MRQGSVTFLDRCKTGSQRLSRHVVKLIWSVWMTGSSRVHARGRGRCKTGHHARQGARSRVPAQTIDALAAVEDRRPLLRGG